MWTDFQCLAEIVEKSKERKRKEREKKEIKELRKEKKQLLCYQDIINTSLLKRYVDAVELYNLFLCPCAPWASENT